MKYEIDLERDESGWWVATARDISGCHTQGRSIRQSLSRIGEALAVCVGEDIPLDALKPRVHLEAEARRVVSRYEAACRRLERDQIAARTATAEAVETLVGGLALSVRDAGDVLGLSHQRVNQLTKSGSA
jgi:predicted RNase H-like HicB family nuclease